MRNWQLERISTIWFLTLGITSLAAGILVYILLLESALGAFRIQDASPAKIGEDVRPRVALLNSNYTRNAHRAVTYRDTSTAWVDQTLLSWREFFLEAEPRNIPFEDISDQDLEAGALDEFEVLVLPSARALSDLQIRRIQEFMTAGGSVLATWQPGIYREDGSWRGWGFMEDTFGLEFQGFVDRGNWNFRIYSDTFPGFTPPGIYLPRYITDSDTFIPPTSAANEGTDDTYRENQQELAEEADFAPLRDYVWFDSLNTARPTVDFARAQPIVTRMRDMDGVMREQDAVVVSYFTWTGFDPDQEIPYPRTSSGIRRLTMRAHTPLTAKVPAGYRVKVQVYNQGVKARITEPERTRPVGFWYDFATDNIVGSDNQDNSTGLAYGTYGEGRFVWMGFQRDAIGVGREDQEDWEVIADLFSNSMNYLRRQPTIWVHHWPGGKEAAAVFAGAASTRSELAAMEPIVDLFEDRGVPGNYYVNPEIAAPFAPQLARMYRQGDVGIYDSLRTEGDGLPEDQGRRLRRLQTQLESYVGGPVRGYKTSERGSYGVNTLGALYRSDFEYFYADSIGRRISPWILGGEYSSLTRIGTTQHSDRDIERGLQGASPDLMNSLLLESMERVHFEGGMYNMSYDPTIMGRGDNLNTMDALVRRAQAQNFWIAPADSIAHWWRLKRALNAYVEQRSPSRLFVSISNDNGATAEEITVSISLGRRVLDVNVRPELINIFKIAPDEVDNPPYKLLDGGTVLELSIRELKPQQYRIFHIDLLGPEMAIYDREEE